MKPTMIWLMAAAVLFAAGANGVGAPNASTWTDPETASKEDPDFRVQGEYAASGQGLQVAALGDGQFHAALYTGGLPGAGWDGSKPACRTASTSDINSMTKVFKKVDRESPTLGAKPSEGAVVLFDGNPSDHIEGPVTNGLLWAGSKTTASFGSFHLHVEFRTPYKPTGGFGGQDRGNSGLYLQDRYEVQILDSFGLDFNVENNALKPKSSNLQWCGCLYRFKHADVNMCFPPLAWQTYDIDFTAPKFDDGQKTANARITVRHNGVVIHDDVELPKGTGAGGRKPEVPKGIINFQGHGNPVAFRNVWLVEK